MPTATPASAAEILESYPLTPLQEGMLFQGLRAPGSGVDVEQVVCHLGERVDADRLARAWTEVAGRHAVLRTRFRWTDVAEPEQQVLRAVPVRIAGDDLAALAPEERERRLERWLETDRARGFDLAEAPAMRLALFRLAEAEHVLVWSFHHIVLDGRSVTRVLREVFALYDAEGEPGETLPPVPRPFREHVEWLSARDADADRAFWTARLRGLEAPEPVRGSRGAPRDPEVEPPFGAREVRLSEPATAALRAFEREHGIWLSALVQGAWALLLGRYTGTPEVVFGVVRGGRAAEVEGVEGMVGLLINTVPVRVRVESDASVVEWLDEIAEQSAGMVPHEHAALADVARWSGLPQGSSLFDTLLDYQAQSFDAPLRAAGGAWERRSLRILRRPGLPLSLSVAGDARLRMRMDYDAGRFDAAAVDAMLHQVAVLLEAMTARPESPVSRLPVVRPGEREALLSAGRAARAFPVAERVHERFERRVARRPDAPALTFAGETLSYGELNARANRLAHRLRALGVGPETRVGIVLERSAELVVALLAVLKAGGGYVPVDPAYPADRVAFVLEDAEAAVVVTRAGLAARLPALSGVTLLVDGDADAIGAEPADDPRVAASADSLAYVIYTSGSTGRPKGVSVTHASVVRLFDATDDWFGFGAEDVWTLFHSFAFDFSVWEIWGALLYGGRLVVVPHLVTRSPEDFHRLLLDEGVTVLSQTPSAFRLLAQAELASGTAPEALGLRWIVFGGEALDPRWLRPWVERHGDRRPRLVNMYGITETTVHVTFREIRRADLDHGGSPIGVPIPDLSLHLLDRHLEPVPAGVPGELFVGGAGVARGYLNRPELTAERFVRDPFSGDPAARLYRTGDLARRRPDGELEYLGRADQQVKIRGFRIETGEIEAALASHADVAGAAVVAREDGEGGKRLVAYLVPAAGRPAPGAAELRAHLSAVLPEHMVPAAFVPLAAFPLTENGKLDRRALPAPGEMERAADAEVYVAPRTPAERDLADVWREVLGVERVGIDDNYITLGGDSIRSVRLVAAARGRGLSISVPLVYRHPTVRELAEVAEPLGGEVSAAPASAPFALLDPAARAGLPDDVEDAYPASRVQLAMLYHTEHDPASLVYLNVNGYRVHTRFDEGALREALRRVTARHPLLRASFDLGAAPEPLLRVHRHAEVPLEVTDLRGLDEAAQDEAFERLKGTGFDWTRPPLLRFHAHLLSDDELRLVLVEHHAVLDGWSVASLMTELLRRFAALRDGSPGPAEAPPAASFRDFVALERDAISSAESRAFWRRVLDGAPVAAIPPREGEPSRLDEAPLEWVDVPPATTAALRRVAEGLGVPLKTVILAAHLRVLSMLSGRDDVVTGYVTSGRPEMEDGDRVLGVFLNTVPLRVRMGGGSWEELIRRVWAAEEAVLPHRRFPLAEIVREGGGGTPFEAALNLNHFHVYDALAASGVRLRGDRTFQKTEIPLVANAVVVPGTGGLRLRLEYDPARLGEEQVRGIGRSYARALAALAAAPEAGWDADGWLDPDERSRLLALGNGPTAADVSTITRRFEAVAARSPGAVAVVCGDARLTYGELDGRANRLAHHLRAAGVRLESRVALCLERGPGLIVAMLAVLKAGGAYVPLDPGSPAGRLSGMLADAEATVLVTDGPSDADLAGVPVRRVRLDLDREAIAAAPAHEPRAGAEGGTLAYVMYTSGSTGRPKAVAVEHRGVVRLVVDGGFARMGPGEAVLQAAPVSFDASTLEIWGALLNGGRLVLMPGRNPSIDELETVLRRHGVTMLWLTAGLFAVVAEERVEALAGVRQLLAGGDVLSPRAVRAVRERFPDQRLVNGYGPTENTTFTCCHTVDEGWDGGPVPIGRPIAGTRVCVLDAALRPVPAGVPGELCTGGAGVARGYLGQPAATAERFVPDPSSPEPGARMYRTGDRVRWRADGTLEFLGRLDAQVKVRGFRVEPAEIEAVLRRHPGVSACAVVAGADVAGGARLVAYVAGGAGEDALRGHVRASLPDYMVPDAFVPVERLPLTANGKVDRRALPSAGPGPVVETAYQPPRTPLEKTVAEIWAAVLELERVGVDEDFFALGGHSLLAMRVVARVRDATGVELPVRALFEAHTVAGLASAVERAIAEPRAALLAELMDLSDAEVAALLAAEESSMV